MLEVSDGRKLAADRFKCGSNVGILLRRRNRGDAVQHLKRAALRRPQRKAACDGVDVPVHTPRCPFGFVSSSAAILVFMSSTKLSHTNPYLRDRAARERGVFASVASSSAIEGIHAPFKTASRSGKLVSAGDKAIPRNPITRAKR